MSDELSQPVIIQRVKKETSLIRTFVFDHSFSFTPGQFVMVWIPGIDEIPMALSSENTITVQKAGDATAAMFELEPGDKLGIRGPFGNGFAKGEKVPGNCRGRRSRPSPPACPCRLCHDASPGRTDRKSSSCLLTSWMNARTC